MATETELVNSALRKIGAQRILDIADEVPSAGIASDVLTQERDYLLRSHNWNFAITRRKLSRLSDAPPFEFEYAFTTPSDCMRIVSVHDNDGGHGSVRYKAESLAQTDGYVAAILTALVGGIGARRDGFAVDLSAQETVDAHLPPIQR
jgi:hypothetical protein